MSTPAPYINTEYKRRREAGEETIEYGANFFWQDLRHEWLASPYDGPAIQKQMDLDYPFGAKVTALTHSVHVIQSKEPLDQRGRMKRLSPNDPNIVVIFALERAIDANEDEDILTVSCPTFIAEKIDNKWAPCFYGAALRNTLQSGNLVKREPWQDCRCCQLQGAV